jgi:8-oxo-dGTP pyrophosphatase MutT (NUDIX family)
MSGERLIRAAGGVVCRSGPGGTEILLVHRPRYDDWSLPKGKLDPGESHKQAAVREVREETGLRCVLGARLLVTSYDTVDGPKRVKWWAMDPEDPDAPLGADDPTEVDALAWVPLGEASERLTHGTDRDVLAAFSALPKG